MIALPKRWPPNSIATRFRQPIDQMSRWLVITSHLVIKRLYTVKSSFSMMDKIRSVCVFKSSNKKIMKYI